MRRWWPLAPLILAVAGLMTGAAAADGEPKAGAVSAFRLHGSHGYEILVLAVSRPGFKHGEVLFAVGRKGAGATYVAPASVTPERIEADLGAVGEIRVAFQPSGRSETAHSRCGNASVPFRGGNWVGAIEFHGEEGYTEVVESSTKALLRPFLDLLCPGLAMSQIAGPQLPGVALGVSSNGQPPKLSLHLNANRRGAKVRVRASIEERRGAVAISRGIETRVPGGSLRWSEDLAVARLAPPAPFSGEATFRRNARPANRWTGNLALDFPGRSAVPIAGSRFSAQLYHAEFSEERIG